MATVDTTVVTVVEVNEVLVVPVIATAVVETVVAV